jgi:hypothetical protein
VDRWRAEAAGVLVAALWPLGCGIGVGGVAPAFAATVALKVVSAGGYHTCGIVRFPSYPPGTPPDDTVTCWGNNSDGESSPPAGTFKAISASWDHTCGIRTSDVVACWGSNTDGQSSTGSGLPAKAISAGSDDTCVIELTGTTFVCWGNNDVCQSAPPRALGIYYQPKTQSPGTGPPSRDCFRRQLAEQDEEHLRPPAGAYQGSRSPTPKSPSLVTSSNHAMSTDRTAPTDEQNLRCFDLGRSSLLPCRTVPRRPHD